MTWFLFFWPPGNPSKLRSIRERTASRTFKNPSTFSNMQILEQRWNCWVTSCFDWLLPLSASRGLANPNLHVNVGIGCCIQTKQHENATKNPKVSLSGCSELFGITGQRSDPWVRNSRHVEHCKVGKGSQLYRGIPATIMNYKVY